jgi:hypothetical protein
MEQLTHMKMKTIILNKVNPTATFNLSSKESHFLIKSILLSCPESFRNQFVQIMSKHEIIAELKYIVYVEEHGRFIDQRTKEIPILISAGSNHLNQEIKIDQHIQNETLYIGFNPDEKFYKILTLILMNSSELDAGCSFSIQIEVVDKMIIPAQ